MEAREEGLTLDSETIGEQLRDGEIRKGRTSVLSALWLRYNRPYYSINGDNLRESLYLRLCLLSL